MNNKNKIEKREIKDEIIEKYENVDEDFEQSFHFKTAKGIYRVGHDSIRLMKWMAFYDKYYT